MAQLLSQVSDPSVSAVLFQSQALIERLRQGFPASEYPPQALRIRYLFELLVNRIQSQLLEVQQQRGRDPETGELLPLQELIVQRVNHLGKLVQTVYECLRYLHASDPQSTPPEIQTAITRLVQQFVVPILGCDQDDVVVLVRPRRTVPNFVDLLRELERRIEVADLDPEGEKGAKDLRSLVGQLWDKQCADDKPPPRYVAVVSYAGLDAHDALLYPVLAHEIGHFIDFAYEGTIHGHSTLEARDRVVGDAEVRQVFDIAYPASSPSESRNDYRNERIRAHTNGVNDQIDCCLREIAADLLATRMLGIPYFIAAAEYLKAINTWPEDVVTDSGYPGIRYRLRLIYEELTEAAGGLVAVERLQELMERSSEGSAQQAIQRVIDYLKNWGQRLRQQEPDTPRFTLFSTRLNHLAQARVERVVPNLRELIRRVIPTEKVPTVPAHLTDLIALLEVRVPPAQPLLCETGIKEGMPDATFGDVLTAGWLYELGIGEVREEKHQKLGDSYREYQNTCKLIFKAIELQEAREAVQSLQSSQPQQPSSWLPPPDAPRSSGVASGPCLLEAMLRKDLAARLLIVPYYGTAPVNSATLDIRLGNWFRIARRTRATEIDVSKSEERARIRREAQQEEYVRFGHTFALHPGDFALGVSLEYVALPPDLMAFVEGKSGLGRAGLFVATATQVAPGFKGSIVLELFNSGTVPLLLRPGMAIAQLVFVQTDCALPPDWLYRGGSSCQVKP